MYAKYTYKATATTAQVLRDLILILTGTTNTASLSASCDTATSYIDTTFCTTGPNLDHDANPASLTQGWRLSVFDEPTTYLYGALTITATALSIGHWSGWNSTTHVGLAGTGSTNTSTIPLASVGTTAGIIYLWSDGKSTLITSGTAAAHPLSILQFTRDDMWRTTANGCHPTVCAGGAWSAASIWSSASPFPLKTISITAGVFIQPGVNYSAVGIRVDVPTMALGAGQANLNIEQPPSALTASGLAQNAMYPIRSGAGLSALALGGSVTTVSPIYVALVAGTPAKDDTFVFGGETYRSMSSPISTVYCVVVRVA